MTILKFDVNRQVIKGRTHEVLVNNTSNFLKLCFEFDEDDDTWGDLTKRVLFSSKNSKVYCKELDNNGQVIVPWPVLTEKYFLFTLYGIGEDDLRVTCQQMKIRLGESGFTTEIEKDLPTESSIVDDIYNRLNNTIEMEVTYSDGSSETFNVVVK